MTEEPFEEPSPEARLLSLNLRLSIVEFMHDDLSHRVDDLEEELDQLWEAIEKIKRKQR